ncbi:MAG TPA: hypothetical protein VIQ27_09955 [Gemmatimonadales bacterium]
MRDWRWLVSPLLYAIYFVLTLAASNTSDLHGWHDLAWPMGMSVLVCLLCCLAALAWAKDRQKAALLALLWFVAFSVYGYVVEALRLSGALRLIGAEAGLGGLFVLGVFGPSLAISRSPRRLEAVNQFAKLVGVCLVVFTIVELYLGLGRGRSGSTALPLPTVIGERAPAGAKPDIYLIILDKYTGGELLQEHFGFDNSAFEGFLKRRGFVVPRSGQANYPQTPLALASMLNLDYLQRLPRDVPLYDMIENNRLAGFLKQQGYRFVFFPTGYRITWQNRHADIQLPPPRDVRGEFAAVWENTTMLPEIMGSACAVIGCVGGRFLVTAQAATLMDWKFERLKDLAGGETPIFVLAHLSLPHEPFLYHADCSHRDLYWPVGAGVMGDAEADRGYLDQIQCANRKLATLVDSILARSRRPPVILLQADHGHGRIGHLPSFDKLNAYQLRERMSAFAAYLLPGVPPGAVGDSVTPVNAVRLVLRQYLGADLPPLEDASYWGLEDRPFDLVRIKW